MGIDVDTSFFTGNHSPRVSIQAATIDDPSVRQPTILYLKEAWYTGEELTTRGVPGGQQG
jgi:allantoicase